MSIWKQRCWMKNCGLLLSAMACTHVSSHQLDIKISDMVAVAHVINATLVIPQLDKRSFWRDTSAFSDIFDERHFITTLQDDVRIVKALPKELVSIPRARKHFTSWSGMGYYEEMA
ncbi:O-fucosyltransferase 38 isoform X2 [Populus alba]|uniref:O-fucosyltransferase family protein n=1 Tax=Populus alba x Populus x berolinensis TaxID=444605 RepID=A0AAD6VX84_9ROSI|nr:O-fucosyltransferase 38-like isoform X2 [Populus alba]KAJ6991157.1 O-fucosyltransferase 38-like isoform X2 [Populus alba x Populus x berolinensis]